MGIAQAIARVKKGVRAGGIPAVMAELGEQLRSEVIPLPLRPAAVRLAELLHAGTPHQEADGSSAQLADPTRDTLPSTPVATLLESVASAQRTSVEAEPEPRRAVSAPESAPDLDAAVHSAGSETSEGNASESSTAPAQPAARRTPRSKAKPAAAEAAAKPAKAAAKPAKAAAKPTKAAAKPATVNTKAAPAARAKAAPAARAKAAPAARAKPAALARVAKAAPKAKPARPGKREKEKTPAQQGLAARPTSANTLARPNAKPISKRPSAKVVSSKRK